MPKQRTFPDGYPITEVNKKDIIELLPEDIDKEIMLDIITDIEEFNDKELVDGRNAMFPFLGTIEVLSHVPTNEEVKEIGEIANSIEEKRKLLRIKSTERLSAKKAENKLETLCSHATKKYAFFKKLFSKDHNELETIVMITSFYTMSVIDGNPNFIEREPYEY